MNLADYAKYGITLRTSQNNGVNYYMVTLTYNKRWAVQTNQKLAEQNVLCAKIKEDGTYCYMTEISNGLEDVFRMIDETIQYNEELEKKVELLKVKAEELKEVFSNNSYNDLLKLKFVIETPQELSKSKNKRQNKCEKKTPQNPNVKPTEAKLGTLSEPEGEPLVDTEQNMAELAEKIDDVSAIDKKIAEVVNKKN